MKRKLDSTIMFHERTADTKLRNCFKKLKAQGLSQREIEKHADYAGATAEFWDARYQRKISQGECLPVKSGSQYQKWSRLRCHLEKARSEASQAGHHELSRAQYYRDELRKEGIFIPWPRLGCLEGDTVSRDVEVQTAESSSLGPLPEPALQPPSPVKDPDAIADLFIPKKPVKYAGHSPLSAPLCYLPPGEWVAKRINEAKPVNPLLYMHDLRQIVKDFGWPALNQQHIKMCREAFDSFVDFGAMGLAAQMLLKVPDAAGTNFHWLRWLPCLVPATG